MRDYNFFESFSEDKKSSELKLAYVGIITSVLMGIMIIIYLVSVFKIKGLKNEIYDMKNIINSNDFKVAYAEKTKGEGKLKILNDYYNSVAVINDLIAKEDYINSELIKTISNVIPQSVSFQNMSISNKIITMNGTSSTRVAIGELEYNLKKLEIFQDIHVSNIAANANDSSSYSFNFNISFKLKEEQDSEN